MPPPSPRHRELLRDGLGALGLLGLSLLCYGPALRGARLWDDPSHLTRPDLQGLPGLRRIWFELGATEQYYPVLHSVFWAEHRLWGDAVLGYHLANVAWHAAACGLLLVALRRLGAVRPGESAGLPPAAPVLAALGFAVHPVAVESVAWMSEQKNTLSLVLYLGAGLAYLRFWRGGRWPAYLLATALFLLALGTKSVTSSLPAALLVVFWWKRGALRRRDLGPLLPWFAASAAMGLTTAWVEHSLIGASGEPFHFSALQRLLLAGRIIWFYLGKLAWPAHLLFFYRHWDVAAEAPGWYGYGLAALGLTAALFLLRRRRRGPLAAWLFFVGTLFPALGFVNVYPFLFSYVADHFQYLASLGVFTAAAAGLGAALAALGPRARAALAVALAGVLALLVAASRRQSAEYRDGATLYRAILAGNPGCWKAHELLGETLGGQPGETAAARREFEAAVALHPDDGEALNNLGNILVDEPGGAAAAEAVLQRAAAAAPYLAEVPYNLARLRDRAPGREAAAEAEYRAALRLNPGLAAAHFALANLLARQPGREAAAEAEFGAALHFDPTNVWAAVNRAGLVARTPARADEAIGAYRAVLQAHPELAPVHYNLAIALAGRPGGGPEAIAEYQATLRLDPGFAGAYRNLGIEFARAGQLDRAEAAWRRAVALEPRYTDLKAKLDELARRGR